MTPKTLATEASADEVVARLGSRAASIQQTPIQNGYRVKLTIDGASAGLNVYPSKGGGCKVVFDDPASDGAAAVASLIAGRAVAPKARAASHEIEPAVPDVSCWIGSDESGKGDYFGPLVTAAVAVTAANWRVLAELGVQDSKNLSDTRARDLAAQVAAAFPNEVVTIMPRRYNELFASMRTVNRMLAWAHARAIEEVLAKTPEAALAVADQFGDESLIRDALGRRGTTVRLVQMHRGERDPAVAAASLLARAEFLSRLDQLGRKAGMRLPKGAGAQVDAAGRALVAHRGADVLDQVAKRHFRNTSRVLGG